MTGIDKKGGEMLNRKFFIAALVVFLIGLIGVMLVTAGDVEKININTATAEELMQLNGVGSNYAARIIEYRENYGPFQTPEDIMQVSGIGMKTFEKNQEIIIVEEPQTN
jgi:competence protein ComEA